MDYKKLKELSEYTSDWNLRLFLEDLLREITILEENDVVTSSNESFGAKELIDIKKSLEDMKSLLRSSISIDDIITLLNDKLESSHESIDVSKEQINKLKKVFKQREVSKQVILKWIADKKRYIYSQKVVSKAIWVYVDLKNIFEKRWAIWKNLISFIWYLYTKAWIKI